MNSRIREELLKRLYLLNTREWANEPLILPQDAERKLSEVHHRSFEIICLLSETDAEALAFKQKVYASVRPDPFGYYSETEILRSACEFAGPAFKRLKEEQGRDQAEAQHDPAGRAQRTYIRQLVETNPMAEGANLEVGGLAAMPKEKVKFCPLGGVITEF
jgi:hypothetical protein